MTENLDTLVDEEVIDAPVVESTEEVVAPVMEETAIETPVE